VYLSDGNRFAYRNLNGVNFSGKTGYVTDWDLKHAVVQILVRGRIHDACYRKNPAVVDLPFSVALLQ
jgi:hypothetical protein